MNDFDHEVFKNDITDVFDLVASGYDSPALRFFPFVADRLVGLMRLQPGDKVLDICCGTGAVSAAAAQAVSSAGRVHAVDRSEAMLGQAGKNLRKLDLHNVDYHVMDASDLEFKSDYFNAVVSSFGLFFMPDMELALKQWMRVAKPGGRIGFTSFAPGAFDPQRSLFMERLRTFGVDPDSQPGPNVPKRLAQPEDCTALAEAVGLKNITVQTAQMGYHLAGPDDWWEVIWNAGLRSALNGFDDATLARFRAEHLEEVSRLAGEDGLWLDIETHFTLGLV